jgi:hypothetical protein
LWISRAESSFLGGNEQIDRWFMISGVNDLRHVWLFVPKDLDFCRRMSNIKKNYLVRYSWKCIAHAGLYSV